MPERWEHEIRKLRELRPSEDLKARVQEGPRGDLPPPARGRVVAAVTALAVFAAAAVFVTRALAPAPDDRPQPPLDGTGAGSGSVLVLDLEVNDGAPGGTLSFGELRQAGVVDGYTWCDAADRCSILSADFVFYPPVSEYLVVPPGTRIEVDGEGLVDSKVRLITPEGDRVADSPVGAVPDADGQYVLAVSASWRLGGEHGDASMFFGVQALSSPAAAPDVLHVDCGYGAARADSAVVRIQSDGLHLVFRGTGAFTEYDVVTPQGTPASAHRGVGGELHGDGPVVVAVSPGRWEVGCGTAERPVEAGDATESFELVDPDGLFTPPPPMGVVPDVLVLRCEGLGPAVDVTSVRLRAEGLYVEATNVADATVVALDAETGNVEALLYPFESATETFVAEVGPGTLWVGCRVPNEQGEIVGGPAEVPDAYIRVTVLAAEG